MQDMLQWTRTENFGKLHFWSNVVKAKGYEDGLNLRSIILGEPPTGDSFLNALATMFSLGIYSANDGEVTDVGAYEGMNEKEFDYVINESVVEKVGGCDNIFLYGNRIVYKIIKNMLGQNPEKDNPDAITMGGAGGADIVADNEISDNFYEIGNKDISFNNGDYDEPLRSKIDLEGSTNNMFGLSFYGFCKSSAFNDSKQPGEDNSKTGLTYGYGSTFNGPLGMLHPSIRGGSGFFKIFGVEAGRYLTTLPMAERFFTSDGHHNSGFESIGHEMNDYGATGFENCGKSHGTIGFNHAQTQLILFLLITRILGRSCSANISIIKGEKSLGNGSEVYEINFDKNQLLAVAHVMKGGSANNLPEELENSSTAKKAAEEAVELIDLCYETINRRSSNIATRIKGLMSISNDIVEVAKAYQRYFDVENSSDLKLRALRSFLKKTSSEDFLIKNFQFMNPEQRQMFNKNIDHFIEQSSNYGLFSSNNNITDKQIKLMTLALGNPDYGFLENERVGSKRILNVGIPAGLFDYLRSRAYSLSEGSERQYLNSNYICIQVFKKSLSPEPILYLFLICKNFL